MRITLTFYAERDRDGKRFSSTRYTLQLRLHPLSPPLLIRESRPPFALLLLPSSTLGLRPPRTLMRNRNGSPASKASGRFSRVYPCSRPRESLTNHSVRPPPLRRNSFPPSHRTRLASPKPINSRPHSQAPESGFTVNPRPSNVAFQCCAGLRAVKLPFACKTMPCLPAS